MNPSSPDVRKALESVDCVSLEHPASALLRAYILEAVRPQAAANYAQRRLRSDGHAGSLIADWVYVIDSVISGTQPRAPSHVEIDAITKRDGGSPRFYLCHLRGSKERSVHNAFQRGVVRLIRLPSSMIEFRVEHVLIDDEQPVDVNGAIALLGDHSRQGIEKADARLIGSHARFSRSIQLVNLARTIAPGLFSEPKTTTDVPQQQFPVRMRSSSLGLGYTFVRPIMLLWRFFPSQVRIATYDLLRKLGSCFYGKDGNAQVQRLPFGLYLKYNSDSDTLRNEYNAIKVMEQKTNIPAPRAFDIVSQSNNEDDLSYLLMSTVPGTPLAICRDSLSDQDYASLSVQLKGCVSQIRDIPKPANHDMVICNTLGEACRDPRIRDWSPIGPFADEA
ncbi:kinase-like domain protein [Fusarium subglutinans]|uniref:Kinase-like domain protein n=1 Tax=Gibberella subglutinans TaxID=42677 RepID=A0A8H5ULS8_GIBSU|nr:kinase-like domain protein [Fusarium subglutinans]KAF5591394.1 kinase-like domain protein [Fusarium subglutinans]